MRPARSWWRSRLLHFLLLGDRLLAISLGVHGLGSSMRCDPEQVANLHAWRIGDAHGQSEEELAQFGQRLTLLVQQVLVSLFRLAALRQGVNGETRIDQRGGIAFVFQIAQGLAQIREQFARRLLWHGRAAITCFQQREAAIRAGEQACLLAARPVGEAAVIRDHGEELVDPFLDRFFALGRF